MKTPGGASTLLWLVLSCVLTVLAFGGVVLGIYGLARALGSVSEENLKAFQLLLPFYFKVVCFRGLLPCLVLTIGFFSAGVRFAPALEASRARLIGGLTIAAIPAYAIVAPLLLMADFDDATAFKMRGVVDHLGTAAGIIGGTALVAWIPRVLVGSLRVPSEA